MRNLLQQTRMELLPENAVLSSPKFANSLASIPDLRPGAHPLAEAREDAFEAYYEVDYDPEFGAFWAKLRPDGPKNFTPALVAALRQGQARVENRVREELDSGREDRLRYQILTSRIPGIFSLGGDLALFRKLIRNQDGDALLRYACACIDLVYTNAVNYKLPVVTISLIQGQALGGGFEAALAANVVVAEKQSKLGLPEVMFNMFPGMGAYQLLTRRLTPARAEELILSGRTYGAEELHQMGLVDVLAEPGEGEKAVMQYIKKHHRLFHAAQGLRGAIQAASPLDYGALIRVAEAWVRQALGLKERDLELMDYLVRAQQRMQP
jgi:DSF synthase